MKINYSRKLKFTLYAMSFAEILLFGFLSKMTQRNILLAIITLCFLALNIVIYQIKKEKK